jgi:membrane protein implicated in regulation of membrane protease activity
VLLFLIIGCIGIALLVLSLVVGDLLDGILDFGGDLFSGAAIAAFLGAFGFVGAAVYDSTDDLTVSALVGIASGAVLGFAAGWVSLRLKEGGDESNVRTGELAGRAATVVSAIPADGYGEVTMVVSGHITRLNARAAEPLATGTPVTITAVLSATAVHVARS